MEPRDFEATWPFCSPQSVEVSWMSLCFVQKRKRVLVRKACSHCFSSKGLDSTIRIDVWKFLLGYYSWDSTYVQRAELRKKRVWAVVAGPLLVAILRLSSRFCKQERGALCTKLNVNFCCRGDYFRMKLQWKSVTPDQERRFGLMKERKNLIGV